MAGDVGARARDLITQHGLTQRAVADAVAMTPDAFSRALSGQRAFGSLEVTRLAQFFGVDVHWLITGEPDPNAMRVAARHAFRQEDRSYRNATRDEDLATLEDVRLAYMQAFPSGPPASQHVPNHPAQVRTILGADFVRHFADRLEERLDVDVVRVGELGTDYSLKIADRSVIAIVSTTSWFRENWSIAHELGHLARGDHGIDAASCDEDDEQAENAANAFAAELLLPEATVRACNWTTMTVRELGDRLWEWGVSTEALRNRLTHLRVGTSADVAQWLRESTVSFLRGRALPASMWRELGGRQRDASTRRFPTALTFEHEQAIADGRLGKDTLAWMLGVPSAAVEVPEPPVVQRADVDRLAAELGLRAP